MESLRCGHLTEFPMTVVYRRLICDLAGAAGTLAIAAPAGGMLRASFFFATELFVLE